MNNPDAYIVNEVLMILEARKKNASHASSTRSYLNKTKALISA